MYASIGVHIVGVKVFFIFAENLDLVSSPFFCCLRSWRSALTWHFERKEQRMEKAVDFCFRKGGVAGSVSQT